MNRFLKLGCAALVGLALTGCAKNEEIDDTDAAEPAEMPAPMGEAPVDGAPAAPVNVQLNATDASGVTGNVMATHTATDVTVDISLNGLTSGSSYPAHIHEGTCATGGAVAVPLSTITATGASAQSTSTVEASKLASDKSYFVQVHAADGKAVACADLPGHGAPAM